MSSVSYNENGVILSRKTLHCGDKVNVVYEGLLAQAGADRIYLHLGYGEKWENSRYIPMEREAGNFSVDIEVQEGKSLSLCFKDAADNWDNNSGENYVFKITKKPEKKVKEQTKEAPAGKKSKEKKVKAKAAGKV